MYVQHIHARASKQGVGESYKVVAILFSREQEAANGSI